MYQTYCYHIHDISCLFLRGVGLGRGIEVTVIYKKPHPHLKKKKKKTAKKLVKSVCTFDNGLCGEQWLSGRMIDSRSRCCGFEPYTGTALCP